MRQINKQTQKGRKPFHLRRSLVCVFTKFVDSFVAMEYHLQLIVITSAQWQKIVRSFVCIKHVYFKFANICVNVCVVKITFSKSSYDTC